MPGVPINGALARIQSERPINSPRSAECGRRWLRRCLAIHDRKHRRCGWRPHGQWTVGMENCRQCVLLNIVVDAVR